MSSSVKAENEGIEVLFVGNSLTYTNDLPGLVQRVAQSTGYAVHATTIATGGATLDQHLADGSVEEALRASEFDFIVLQERGGDQLCPDSTDQCPEAEHAFRSLAELARDHGATPISLGTYQARPEVSRALLAGERRIATGAGAGYIQISSAFNCGRDRFPDLDWIAAPDDFHPGPTLTLTMAAAVHASLFGELPDRQQLEAAALEHDFATSAETDEMSDRVRAAAALYAVGPKCTADGAGD